MRRTMLRRERWCMVGLVKSCGVLCCKFLWLLVLLLREGL